MWTSLPYNQSGPGRHSPDAACHTGRSKQHPRSRHMSKRARKRRDRKKNGANHGKKPNA
ncbi:hypothetical protein GCM10023214_68390 [Amycolatopsis dongchuanensis]|uniref:Uncharacterized protein n=1 Tax=Amycolatopsis dongchuanensis TaxID=1070866 RepID=A0ABP8VLB5_9PSEU